MMRKRFALLAASLAMAAGVILAPAANAGVPPCSYGNYFGPGPAYVQIKATPVEKYGTQAGKAWCVGFSRYVAPSDWVSNQRLYERTTGN